MVGRTRSDGYGQTTMIALVSGMGINRHVAGAENINSGFGLNSICVLYSTETILVFQTLKFFVSIPQANLGGACMKHTGTEKR